MRLAGTTGWLLHRATGMVLLVGLAVHFYVMHFAGARSLTYELVMARLRSPRWMAFNALFLVSAIYHGFTGLWGIALEHISGNPWLRAARFALTASALCLAGVGFYVLTLG